MSENTNEEILNENLDNQEPTTENSENGNSEVDTLKEELQKEKDQYLRLFAEFDNYKKRTTKERFEIFKTANSEVITALLPVLDDFERASKEIEKSVDQDLFKGISLIQHKLIETLRGKGLKSVEIKAGDEFDTDKMEAITQIPAPSDDLKGKVVDVVETGYALNDKVIRYAKVVIGQ
jgi:molecular chaperone GrpE